MKVLAFACLAALLGASMARGEDAKKGPRDWSWLAPGRTTPDEAKAKAGKPDAELARTLEKGRLEMDPRSGRAGAFGPEAPVEPELAVPVKVLLYKKIEGEVHDNQLVFFKGRLLYAVVRPSRDEETVGDIEKKYGSHKARFIEAFAGCEREKKLLMEVDTAKVAFVTSEAAISCTECKLKVAFADAKDFAPDFDGVKWRFPDAAAEEGEGGKK